MTEKDDSVYLQSSLSSHRLPTISASQALQKLNQPGGNWVTTGLSSLDTALNGSTGITSTPLSKPIGGYAKGRITEIYGPPAAGKTALALQAAAEALSHGNHVVWIDANKPLYGPRLIMHLPKESHHQDLLARFHHYTTPTLPHLLALICHPPPAFPPTNTTLFIIDGVSAVFTAAYPENPIDISKSRKKTEEGIWLANRRYAVMAEFLSKLNKLAAVRDLAAVLISQTSLKVRTELGAILRPSIWTKSWSDGIRSRIIVFRDFFHDQDGTRRRGVRFVAVAKVDGVVRTQVEHAVPFRIEADGCREIRADMAQHSEPVPLMPTPRISPQKRKRKRIEIADSQSEDSDADLLDPIDYGVDGEEDQVVEMHVSYAQDDDGVVVLDPGIADFEAALEAGFEDE